MARGDRMSDNPPTSYAELVDVLANLPVLVRETRRRKQLSVRAAAMEAGVSFATLSRFEAGEDARMSTVRALLTWTGH
jgi:predicted transcriptional regulator